MTYEKLSQIVVSYANQLKSLAAWSGSRDVGGALTVLNKLSTFRTTLITKYDLRPSEYNQLDDKEVGEPKEFIEIINEYKMELAKDIKL